MNLRILGKVLLPILLVVVVASGSGFYFSYSVSHKAIQELLIAELNVINRLMNRNLDSFIIMVERDLQNLSRLQRMQNSLLDESEKTIQIAAEAFAQFTKDYSYVETIAVADLKGRVVAASSASLVGKNISSTKHFQATLKGEPAISEPVHSPATGQFAMVFTYPVIVKGKTIGVLLGFIPLQHLSDEIIKGVNVAQTGYPFIVDANGLFIAHPQAENIGKVNINTFQWGKEAMAIENGLIWFNWEGADRLASVLLNKKIGCRVMFALELSDVSAKTAPAVKASIVAMLLVLLLISLSMFILLRYYISKPLGLLAQAATKVAHGDLSLDMHSMDKVFAGKGELTETHQSIGLMLTSLKETIALADQKSEDAARQTELARQATEEAHEARKQAEKAKSEGMRAAADQLEGSIGIISSASEQLSAQIEQSGRGAEEQSARVAEAATAMEEMNITVIEVAKNASSAAEMSTNTRNKADDGAQIVQKVVTSIRTVRDQSITLKNDMNVLSGHAQSINQIMSVISDIADQTNLLALNAAIEAARAGDAGRGFAVVADEVRKLAEKTMLSTTDVSQAIQSIQQSAAKNMQQVDLTVQTIENATSLADNSGHVLLEIVTMADKTADQVNSIATASEEQSATSEEINRSISHVSGIASQTSHAMKEASHAVADLASQAQSLQNLVQKMKVE